MRNFRQGCLDCTSIYVSRGSILKRLFYRKWPFSKLIWNFGQKSTTFGKNIPSGFSTLKFTYPEDLLKIKKITKGQVFCSWMNKTFLEIGECFLRGIQNWSQLVQRIYCGSESLNLKNFDNHFPILSDNFLFIFGEKMLELSKMLSTGREERSEEKYLF